MHPHDNRFNSPGEMLTRLVFAAHLGFALAGVIFFVISFHEEPLRYALMAMICFTLALTGRIWLERDGRFQACERSLDAMFAGETDPEPDDELGVLISRREALEQQRGTVGFDPWEVQVVRREIMAYVREHPETSTRLDRP